MKKFLIILLLTSCFSLSAFAAKYKINTSGKVTAPNGKSQNSSVLNNPTNFYNNYSAKNYVNSQQVTKTPIGTIDIVMDYSGSMYYWINEAKKTMSMIVSQLPTTTAIGFRVFGHNSGNNPYTPVLAKVKEIAQTKSGKYKVTASQDSYLGNVSGGCSATSQIIPVKQNNALKVLSGMNSVNVGGATPLTLALKQAVEFDFSGLSTTYPKKIILITDGGENCGGDPCAYAAKLASERKDIIVDVVLVSSYYTELKCLANVTGGKFYTPQTPMDFSSNLIESVTQQAAPQNSTDDKSQKYEFIND